MIYSTARELFNSALTSLYNEDEASELFFIAAERVCNVNKSAYILKRNIQIPAEEHIQLQRILEELKTGTPVQYIFGQADFYGLKFNVNHSVLIPRPETEELVDWILNEEIPIKSRSVKPDTIQTVRILDIGTGSGCIAISLKINLPSVHVYAIDVSSEALIIAGGNAGSNFADVTFKLIDILKPVSKYSFPLFDIIVSNPPYVTVSEKTAMHANVLGYEPHLALFVPDEDPLLFYEKIADFAIQFLAPEGLLFFEINEERGASLVSMLSGKGFKNIELRKDINGKDRMLKAAR